MISNPDIVINPQNLSLLNSLKELWTFRGIFRNLCIREWRSQFVDMRLGFVWVFARPFLMTMIFILLKRGASAQVDLDTPFPVYVFSGTLLWFTWVEAVSATSAATRANANIISKIYFPRLYSPAAKALVGVAKMALGFIPLAGFMIYYHVIPDWKILLLPLVILQTTVTAFAIGTIFSILAVSSPDWDRFRGLVLYIGIFLSPVIYSADTIPAAWQPVYALNPMVGSLDLFRASISADHILDPMRLTISAISSIAFFIAAVFSFKRNEVMMLDRL